MLKVHKCSQRSNLRQRRRKRSKENRRFKSCRIRITFANFLNLDEEVSNNRLQQNLPEKWQDRWVSCVRAQMLESKVNCPSKNSPWSTTWSTWFYSSNTTWRMLWSKSTTCPWKSAAMFLGEMWDVFRRWVSISWFDRQQRVDGHSIVIITISRAILTRTRTRLMIIKIKPRDCKDV